MHKVQSYVWKEKKGCMLDYFYFMNNILLTLIYGGFLFSWVRIFFLRNEVLFYICSECLCTN